MCARYRDAFDEQSLVLAAMLQSWDVLGVYRLENRPTNDEEYDDLVEPIREWLENGAGPEELSTRLVRRLESHYGLQSNSDLAEINFARKVHSWWWSCGER
jgi:hypothetical protein